MLSKRLGNPESPGELPGMRRGCTDITGLSGLDDVVQRLERLFDGCAVIPAMDLIKIDLVGAETAQAILDLTHDRLAR